MFQGRLAASSVRPTHLTRPEGVSAAIRSIVSKSLREALVNRPEADNGLGLMALIAQQAGEAHRGAQRPRQRSLPVC